MSNHCTVIVGILPVSRYWNFEYNRNRKNWEIRGEIRILELHCKTLIWGKSPRHRTNNPLCLSTEKFGPGKMQEVVSS